MKPKKMTQRQVENLLCEILPRTYRKQELQLVRRAKDEKSEYKLYEYYRTWGLCEAAEAELIKKAPLWMLEDYVERTKNLCVAAQVALVERRNKKSIMDYIHKDPFPASRAKKALLKWDSPDAREIVMEMLQNEFQQKFFAYYAPLDLLFEAWNILDSDCRAILIQRAARKDSNLVDKIATDKGKQIDKTDEAMFVRYCSDEALKRFIMRPLHSEAQMVLIKKRSASIVQAYLDQRAFTSKEAVDILAKKYWNTAFERQMQSRDPFDISIELQVKILKRGSIKAKEALVKKVKLNQDVEIVLLQHTGFDFAMKYIQRHSLSPKAQEFLVCKGSEALAMYFIDHNDLCPTAKILLVMQGNHDKIMAMLQNKQRLDGTIAKALLKRRNKEEIEQYLRNQYPKLLPLK